jgi:hypothetical protein
VNKENRQRKPIDVKAFCAVRSSAKEDLMDAAEIQAKAAIAAALIASHAVEIPTIPKAGRPGVDGAAIRLRDLTEYVYQTIIGSKA